jgi:hypothetical protein
MSSSLRGCIGLHRTLMTGACMGLLAFFMNACSSIGPQAGVMPHPVVIAPANIPQGAVAQLVAGNLTSPLRDVTYTADWFLDLLLALGPQGRLPKTRDSIGSYRSTDKAPLAGFAQPSFSRLAKGTPPLVNKDNETEDGRHVFLWHGVGLRMSGLQVVTALNDAVTAEQVREIWLSAYEEYGRARATEFVLIHAPGRNGWAAWEAALPLIATPAARAIWLTSSDAPNFPQSEQPSETGVQLVIAHPAYDSGRKPLAYFTTATSVPYSDSLAVALQKAAEQALNSAGLKPADIGRIVRDSGMGNGGVVNDKDRRNENAEARKKAINEAVRALFVEGEPLIASSIDLTSTLGDLGASTVNLSLLIGAFACHEGKQPVLYLSARDPGVAHALLILPSPDYSETDVWRRAAPRNTGERDRHRPWGGQHRTARPDR